LYEKGLKIPKGESEAVNRIRKMKKMKELILKYQEAKREFLFGVFI
jgi:hypothetical protein